MKQFLLSMCLLFLTGSSWGQTTIFTHAGGGIEPSGWTFTNNVSTYAIDRTTYWLVDAGSPSDIITTTSYDLSAYATAELNIRVATFGSGLNNPAKIEISFDGGSTFPQSTTTSTPTSSTYIDGGPIALNSVSNQVVIRISNNTSSGKGVRLQNIILTADGVGTPTVSIANTGSPSAGDILQGTSDAVLFGFSLTPSASIDFTADSIATSGTATTDDVSNFRLILDANNNGAYDGGETVVQTLATLANPLVFDSFSNAQNGLSAETRYLVVADFDVAATVGRTLTLSIDAATDVITTGDESGSATGNTQTIISASAPVITLNGTISAFGNIAAGTSSTSQFYSVEGSNLSADITITPPSGFEVSTDNTTFVDTNLILTQAGGSVATTTIYVRFSPVFDQGSVSESIMHQSSGATTQYQAVEGYSYASEPTTAASGLSFTSIGETSFTINWSNSGNGDTLLILMKSGSPVDFDPVDTTPYNANSVFGTSQELGTGNYAVFVGNGSSIEVTGLSAGITYHVEIFVFNASDDFTQNYNVSSTLTGDETTTGPDLVEGLESGSKGSYTTGDVTLSSGSWSFNDALIGSLANDKKNGTQSARLQASGYIEMNFDYVGGVGTLSYNYASYGSDGAATVEAFYSVDEGLNWVSLGTQSTTTSFKNASISVNITTPVRFRIGKTGGTRVNIDDISFYNTTTGNGYRAISGTAGWRMLSSPKSGFTVADISDNTAIQGVAGGSNATADSNFYTYTSEGAWNTPSNVSTPIADGYGFITYFYNNETASSSLLPITLDITGTEPGSDVDVTLNTTTAILGSYFTLVGNPFASNLNTNSITATGGTFQANIQFWNNATSAYVIQDRTGSFIVAPWSGFWVESTDGATSITIPTSGKTASASGTSYFAKEAVNTLSDLKFELQSSYNTDAAIQVQFREQATFGWDLWDASKFTSLNANYALLGFQGEAGKNLKAVESLPSNLSEVIEIPMEVLLSGSTQEVNLSWNSLATFPEDWTFTLIDAETNSSINLREVESYAFVIQGSPAKAKGHAQKNPIVSATGNARLTLAINPGTSTTSVDAQNGIPSQLELSQNYPNPFNPSTQIQFALPAQSNVRLSVFDMLGREVAILVNGDKPAGKFTVNFDGSTLSSGMYMYRLVSNGSSITKKLTLIK